MSKRSRNIRSMNARKRWLVHRLRRRRIMGALLILFILAAGAVTAAAAVRASRTYITLEVQSTSIKQGEQMPVLQAEVTCDKKEKKLKRKVLDKETGYTAWDLLEELREGEHYQLLCDSDGVTEGKYLVRIELDSDFEKKLGDKGDWNKKVILHTEDGSFTVLNQVGKWDGDRFKKWDGSYVQNDFVNVKGKTYYFGEDGVKVTGWKEIGVTYYHFDKDGVMQTDMWLDKGESRAYLQSDGKAAAGWFDLDGATYYFTQEGEMVTGKKRIGTLDCVFSEDGKLESQKSSIDPDKPMMALTFDDGPGERTGELLDMLEKYDAHATFFMQGVNIPGREDTVKQMLEADCELGNHSYDHPELTKISDADIRAQVGNTNDLIKEACGQGATLIRPPYGSINDAVKANVGMPMILWNVDTLDWKGDTQTVINSVLQNADDGDIVLLHDIHSTTVDAALQLIPRLVDEGYQLVTVSEMAQARGINMKAGETYTDFNK